MNSSVGLTLSNQVLEKPFLHDNLSYRAQRLYSRHPFLFYLSPTDQGLRALKSENEKHPLHADFADPF